MKKKITITILAMMSLCTHVMAQSASQNQLVSIPPTPEASSLFKFVETPVAEFNGIPNINIPIYNISLKSINFPISIKYHSAGNKLEEQSGNLGLGWAIEAGGTVSSTVFGDPDFILPYPIYPQDRPLGPVRVSDTGNDDYVLLMSLVGKPTVTNSGSSSVQAYDTKPDLFYYSMFDRSGKFFFTNDGKAHTIPASKLSIERVGGYTIIDEQGIKYVFGMIEQTTTSSATFGPTGWGGLGSNVTHYNYHLTQISTPANDTLTFSYRSDSYSYHNTPSYTRYRTLPGQPNCVGADIETRVETTTSVIGKFLTEITSNRGHHVQFIYDTQQRLDMPGTYALKQVVIYEGDNSRSVVLEHEYLGINAQGEPNQPLPSSVKLKLKHLTDAKGGNYHFDYYDEYGSYPTRDSQAMDHWGYYNGTGGIFPADPRFGYPSGANKEPDFMSTVKGVLKRVTYPTKGYTDFEYELHQYPDTVNSFQSVMNGAAIYYEDYSPSPLTRTVNFTIPATVDPNSIQVTYECTDGSYNPQFSIQLYNNDYSVNKWFTGVRSLAEFIYLLPGQYTISLYQNGIFENGYFRILWNETVEGPPVVSNIFAGGLRIKTIKDFDGIGTLAQKTIRYTYNQTVDPSRSSGQLFSKPSYSYIYSKRNFEISTIDIRQLNETSCNYYAQTSRSNLPLSGLQNGNVVYTEVQKYTETNNELNEGYVQNKYSFANKTKQYGVYPFTTETSYEWMSGHLLKSEVYGKEGNSYVLKKRISNVYNYNFTPGDFILPTQPNETHAMGLNILVERPEYRIGSLEEAIYPAQFLIEYYKLVSSWVYLSSSTEELFEGNGVLTSTISNRYLNPLHAQISEVTRQHSDGKDEVSYFTYPLDYVSGIDWLDDLKTAHVINIPIEQVVTKVDGTAVSILSGEIKQYKTGGKAQLDNIYTLEYEEPKLLSAYKFSHLPIGQMPTYASMGTFVKDMTYVPKFEAIRYDEYTNVEEYALLHGAKKSYLWSYNGLYPIAEILDIDYQHVLDVLGGYTAVKRFRNTEPDKASVDAFLAPLRLAYPNAHISSYSYKPLVGMTSHTDAKGMTTYYEYDDFNRLNVVKDHNGHLLKRYDYHYKP
jgi:hypothetical protein